MTSTHQPYPTYRPSGVEWLGEIPAHWKVKRLKFLFQVINGATPSSAEPLYWNGDIAWVTPDDLGKLSRSVIRHTNRRITAQGYESCGVTLVPEGSLVLSTRAPIGHIAIAAIPLCTNQGCRSLIFRQTGVSRFFYYQLIAARRHLASLGQGSTFTELSKDALGGAQIVDPPLPEQRAIAAYLDRETARTDALVAKKERLIELLREKRTALITRAVTRGLDPDAPMRDSGVEWLGEIPAHWDVRKLKVMVPGITVGIVVTPSRYYVDQGVPCLRSLNIAHGRISTDALVFISEESNLLHKKSRIFADDVLIVRTGRAGAAVVVPPELDGANCIDLLIVRRSELLFPQFLYYLMNSRVVGAQVSVDSVGAIQEHYNTSTLSNLRIPYVPLREQQAIAAYLDRETAELDALAARVREAIDRLRELRTALISAAVTGRIDVREVAAGS